MSGSRYPRHIIEMALLIRDDEGVADPKQVADLIAEKTNDAYRPSEKAVRYWFDQFPPPMGSDLKRLRMLAELDYLPNDFKEVALFRRDGEWKSEITLLKKDETGFLSPMAPGVYRNAQHYQNDNHIPKHILAHIKSYIALGWKPKEIAAHYQDRNGKTVKSGGSH